MTDPRSLLKKYIEHIGRCMGESFLDPSYTADQTLLSTIEIKILRDLDEEMLQEHYGDDLTLDLGKE